MYKWFFSWGVCLSSLKRYQLKIKLFISHRERNNCFYCMHDQLFTKLYSVYIITYRIQSKRAVTSHCYQLVMFFQPWKKNLLKLSDFFFIKKKRTKNWAYYVYSVDADINYVISNNNKLKRMKVINRRWINNLIDCSFSVSIGLHFILEWLHIEWSSWMYFNWIGS